MIISSDILRSETVRLIKQINMQIEDVEKQAKEIGVAPELLRDGRGNYIMAPMLLAKVQAYATLVRLQAAK